MPLPPKLKFVAGVAALLLAAAGCTREIGDGCTTGTDCSQTGGRTCDTTLPGGYCTIANCDPDSCPSEAACIGFMLAPSTAPECRSEIVTRELRQFCMRRCAAQDDCRGGYVCAELNADKNPWGAVRLDKNSNDGRVCVLDYAAIPEVERPDDLQVKGELTYCGAADFTGQSYYAVGGSGGLGVAGSAGVAGNSNAGAAGNSGSSGTSSQAGNAGASSNAGAGNASEASGGSNASAAGNAGASF